MDLDLTGKRALVTGSTRGIGLATAVGLAQMGAEVIVNGREKAAVDQALAKIRQSAPSAKLHAAVLDLGGAEGCAALTAQFPDVDILVNNLGIYEPKAFFDIEDADWTKMFEVNVMSGVRLTRHYLKRMLEGKEWGRVVFVSSESGIFVPKEMVHYGFSKAAQLYIARGAAEQTKGDQHHRQFGAAGPDLGRDGAGAPCRACQGHGNDGRRSRRAHLFRTPAGVAAAALCPAGRDRQSDLLSLLESRQRHQWRGLAGGRRNRDQSVLSVLTAPRCVGKAEAWPSGFEAVRPVPPTWSRTSAELAPACPSHDGGPNSNPFFVELVRDQRRDRIERGLRFGALDGDQDRGARRRRQHHQAHD